MNDTISTLSSAQQSLHYSLLSAFLKGTAKIPQMPENSLRIRSLLRDPDASLVQLSHMINRDPPLAAYLMQFADSPLIKSARPCRSLTDVLARLGTNQLNNLILAFSIRHMFISKELSLQKGFRARWNASSMRAAWSACLAPLVSGISADDALLGGLFQDIGSLPLLAELENWPQTPRDEATLNDVCAQLSAPIGTILLTAWKQPSNFVDCARYRNSLAETPTHETTQLYELVQIGEALQNPNKHQTLGQLPLAQQIFANLDAHKIQQQLKEHVNLWFLLLGVKTRIK